MPTPPPCPVPSRQEDVLTPAQARERFADQEQADDARLMRVCWQSLAVSVGLGLVGLLVDRPSLMGAGLVGGGGILWREHRRRQATPAPCPVSQALTRWINAQPDPQAAARELYTHERYGADVARVAGEHLHALRARTA